MLTQDRLLAFLKEKVLTLGTAACPPYHLAIVIGGTSVESTMKTVKLASAKYLDALPTQGSEFGNAFRDLEMEQEILKMTQSLGVGAQFGGKYFCHDVRVIRLPRHGASLPIGLGVSCSADRQVLGKITRDGVYLEQLEHNPAQYLPEVEQALGGEVVKIDLNQPMQEILATLAQAPDQDPAVAHRHHDRRPRLPPTPSCASGWRRASRCRTISRTIRCTTPARPRRPTATPPARSARPRRGGWIVSSTSSRPPAARW